MLLAVATYADSLDQDILGLACRWRRRSCAGRRRWCRECRKKIPVRSKFAAAAASATRLSSAAAPALTICSLHGRLAETARRQPDHHPGMPPSRTIRLEPTPTTQTGSSRGKCVRKYARSSSSDGVNSTCAGPPTRNQVSSASDWFGQKPAAQVRHRGFKIGCDVGKAHCGCHVHGRHKPGRHEPGCIRALTPAPSIRRAVHRPIG